MKKNPYDRQHLYKVGDRVKCVVGDTVLLGTVTQKRRVKPHPNLQADVFIHVRWDNGMEEQFRNGTVNMNYFMRENSEILGLRKRTP